MIKNGSFASLIKNPFLPIVRPQLILLQVGKEGVEGGARRPDGHPMSFVYLLAGQESSISSNFPGPSNQPLNVIIRNISFCSDHRFGKKVRRAFFAYIIPGKGCNAQSGYSGSDLWMCIYGGWYVS